MKTAKMKTAASWPMKTEPLRKNLAGLVLAGKSWRTTRKSSLGTSDELPIICASDQSSLMKDTKLKDTKLKEPN
jgi:hypothetical protein